MSDSFVARQTANLQQLVKAGEIQNKPETMRGREEQQLLSVQSSPCRCLRCGNLVYPIVAMPGPYLCEQCRDELLLRDRHEVPGCSWWPELLDTVRQRTQENTA